MAKGKKDKKGKKDTTREIHNKRAEFEYFFVSTFEAGIALQGTEIKSIRTGGSVNLKDAYCVFRGNELYAKSIHISPYKHGTYNNHEARRDRKLLLRKIELRKLLRKVKEKGASIIPFRLYFTERGFVKIEIALTKGKKSYDKRHSIKERENKRDLARLNKIRLS